MSGELVPGQTVETTDVNGEIRYGVYLGVEDGFAQIAYPTANVPLEQIKPLWLDVRDPAVTA